MVSRSNKRSTARFMVISLALDQAEIVQQGIFSQETFQRLFLDPYELSGERYHPGKDATMHGVLLAADQFTVVTVPIWKWKAGDGAPRFLCQASDDGRAPSFSVFSLSESDLVNQISQSLRLAR